MASSEGNYHRRGPYFDGTNFASWKHKMKIHILGHNPAVWAILCIGLQGGFFDGREPNREATAEELKIPQYNAQACDILFNGLCPEEFNKISRLENAKSDHHSGRNYHSGSEYTQDEGVAGPALVLTNSYNIFDSPNEGIGRCFMAKGPKVSHPEYVDFNSDEDDLLGDDDLLVDNSSDENYDELAINHANQDKMNDDDKKEIERLTKELNTLKLAHETTLVDHRVLLKTHEKLRFENLNLEQEHGFLKAINDDLRKKSSYYIAKHLLLSTYMPQVKSSNKSKKYSSSSSNNNHVKSNVVTSSSSLDSSNDSLSQVTLEQKNSLLKGIIDIGVYKILAGSKQFEEIVRKQGRYRKNQGVGFERKFNANGVEWEEDQYPKMKFVPQQEKYDPTPFKGTQAQDDLPPQDHKQKGKDKIQEEIDAFEEAPKALVKWVPKNTSSSTSSSTTTTPRIPIKLMWIPKKKN
ncbi:unnamed protein product [Triticum aestivum]|uniref:Uncharacterized protein n=1 Tax=Triticum aestivum TaxID=4565 RepID=A0A7H4LHW5_WHEAT|nr:unnamed protein product [Triticum aestivum]